jgi:eukaryotic-like serine/threonine-protein kinase
VPLQGDAAQAQRPTYTNITPLASQGNMSVVYKAHHEGFDKPCVQKVVIAAGMPAAIAFAEPRLLDQLKHDNLVPVLETQPDPHNPAAIVFTMPYYRQGSIRFALEQRYRFSLHEAVDIACDILAALGHLHANGLVHRDVKAANALLTDNLRGARLTDLGLAARLEGDGKAPGGVGSPLFMPPEAFGPGSRVGPTADTYSAALTIFEFLNGPLDYTKVDLPTAQLRLASGQRAMPDSMLEFEPHVPASLRRAVRKGMKVKPSERFASARAFNDSLRSQPLVDWREVRRGTSLEGEWEGTWPPRLPTALRRGYRVEVSSDRSGLLAVALQRTTATGPWRRFGVLDRRLRLSDSIALAQFFSSVNDKAAQAVAAR